MDYGSYACDNAYNLTINGGSIAMHAKNNSSDD
jgi:hypothetical protein